MKRLFSGVSLGCLGVAVVLTGCGQGEKINPVRPIAERIEKRDFPSVFRPWDGIDMKDVPIRSAASLYYAAARHDVLWEEPLGPFSTVDAPLLGALWNHPHPGLATRFTAASLASAREARAALLQLNPDLVCLLELRWRDAPAHFLPAESPWWADATAVGPGRVRALDATHPDLRANVARQAKIAVESGLYDGILLHHEPPLALVRAVRERIGDEALLLVGGVALTAPWEPLAPWVNGLYLESNPQDATSDSRYLRSDWDALRAAAIRANSLFREPVLNCLEVWGARTDLSRMRATTALALVYTEASVLYADTRATADDPHRHAWFIEWNAPLGVPLGPALERRDGAVQRDFEGGTVIYNHIGNGPVRVEFPEPRVRASDSLRGTRFLLPDRDGDSYLHPY